jgi:hypothetical protein
MKHDDALILTKRITEIGLGVSLVAHTLEDEEQGKAPKVDHWEVAIFLRRVPLESIRAAVEIVSEDTWNATEMNNDSLSVW